MPQMLGWKKTILIFFGIKIQPFPIFLFPPGDNVDCWMEIQQGKGPWASPVTGIVPLGTTLTMVIGIDDKNGEFVFGGKSRVALTFS